MSATMRTKGVVVLTTSHHVLSILYSMIFLFLSLLYLLSSLLVILICHRPDWLACYGGAGNGKVESGNFHSR
jgi:hypothetical protein